MIYAAHNVFVSLLKNGALSHCQIIVLLVVVDCNTHTQLLMLYVYVNVTF